jgi:hypothetical protein
MSADLLAKRITEYLSGGGLFNPELANHEAVRDLLIECRDAFKAQPTMYLVPDDCPRDDFDQPIIYITNEVNLVAHSLTGSEGEEDALTELKGMARYVSNVWPGKTALQVLLEYEEAALPSAKRVPLSDEQIRALLPKPSQKGWIYEQQQLIEYCRIVEAAHGITESKEASQ